MRLGAGHPNGAPRREAARLGRTATRREDPEGHQGAAAHAAHRARRGTRA